jgi:hypothetical protein
LGSFYFLRAGHFSGDGKEYINVTLFLNITYNNPPPRNARPRAKAAKFAAGSLMAAFAARAPGETIRPVI